MSATAAAAYVERRRSPRIPVRLAIIVCEDSGPFQEQTCISSLNAHGVLVPLAAPVTVGQRLVIQNPENWAERSGRVTRVGRCYGGRTEVGIEFTGPAPDFWLIPSSPKRIRID
jgi:hypothetical protein